MFAVTMMIKTKYPILFLLLLLLGACSGYSQIQEKRSENPYYFPAQRLRSKFESSRGSFKVVEKFNERYPIHRGIENYRVSFIETNPDAFILPHHTDAETVAIVVRGRGVITVAKRFHNETYNLSAGDVLRVKAGNIVYGANSGNTEKFKLALLAQSLNTPGISKAYFSAGGGRVESFFKVFSNNILEKSRDQIDNLFERQKHGPILEASKDQIEALGGQVSSRQQIGQESSHLFNVLQHPLGGPSRYGRMFEAIPEGFEQLGDVNVLVGLLEINQV